MTVKGDSRGYHDEDAAYYITYGQARAVKMALDTLFAETIQGNLPLTSEEEWWQRTIITERVVPRYHDRWCIFFEFAKNARTRFEEQADEKVHCDDNLNWESHGRNGWKPLEWEA